MKYAVSTLGCPAWSFPEIVRKTSSYGFDAIEVRGIGTCMAPDELVPFGVDEAAQSNRLLKEYGLSICTLATSVKLTDLAAWPNALKEWKSSLALCHRMHIPSLRVFGNQIIDAHSIVHAVDHLHVLCQSDASVQVLLEVHGDFRNVEVFKPIMDEISEPNFGIIWDVAHSDETYGDAWQPFYEVIAPRVREVHIKDYHRNLGRDGLCLMGQGDIPWKEIVRRLKQDGFDGYYTLEWEKRWHPDLPEPEVAFPQYVAFLRNLESSDD